MKKMKLLKVLAPTIMIGGGFSTLIFSLSSCSKKDDLTTHEGRMKYLKENAVVASESHTFAGDEPTIQRMVVNSFTPTQDDYDFVKKELNVQLLKNFFIYKFDILEQKDSSIKIEKIEFNIVGNRLEVYGIAAYEGIRMEEVGYFEYADYLYKIHLEDIQQGQDEPQILDAEFDFNTSFSDDHYAKGLHVHEILPTGTDVQYKLISLHDDGNMIGIQMSPYD
jgi:hypothetical protein